MSDDLDELKLNEIMFKSNIKNNFKQGIHW